MSHINDILEDLRFFKKTQASNIKVDKENIFYREKYTEILNYFKLMITTSEELEVYNYIDPKGTLLINAYPGTDLLDYLRLISKNYYLDIIDLDISEIKKSPNIFFEDINESLEKIHSSKEKDESIESSEKDNNKIIIIINQSKRLKTLLEGKSLLNSYMDYWRDKFETISYKKNKMILVWVTTDYQEFINNSIEIYKAFDLFINIPILSKIERETILREFAENNTKISFDISTIVAYTENWEVLNLKQLLKVAILKHFLNSDLNETTNEVTDIIVALIESGEFIPSLISNHMNNHKEEKVIDNMSIGKKIVGVNDLTLIGGEFDELVKGIQNQGYTEFMLGQLYEDAASKNYSEIMLIIDKLKKKEPLEDNDRKLLAKYPFILNDIPNRAHLNLEKAKKRVDLIKLAFGKE